MQLDVLRHPLSRIDCKYVMSLELTDSRFDSSVLSEFRSRLITSSTEDMLLNIVLQKCKERKWLIAKEGSVQILFMCPDGPEPSTGYRT
jgi:hypothetical protein